MMGQADPDIVSMIREIGDSGKSEVPENTTFSSLYEVQRVLYYIRMDWEQDRIPTAVANLKPWTEAFERFKEVHGKDITGASDKRALALIEMRLRLLRIDLYAEWGTTPELWDGYCDEFDKILDYAETAMTLGSSGESGSREAPQFYLHPGTVAILYGVVRKCREPRIRKRALSLLMRRPIQEGLWNTDAALRLSLRITMAEGETQSSTGSAISAQSRIHQITTKLNKNNQYVVGYEMDHGWVWDPMDNYKRADVEEGE